MNPIPTLETDRLRLRGFRIEDFEPYAAMLTEPAVLRYIGGVPLSREVAWTRFARAIGLWHLQGFGFWMVEDRNTGAFLGQVGFHDVLRDIEPSLVGTMEAGWMLVGAAQRRGIAEEAMRAALTWADEHRPRDRMTCIINPENGGSLRVAEKLGFEEFARSTLSGMAVVVLERVRRSPR